MLQAIRDNFGTAAWRNIAHGIVTVLPTGVLQLLEPCLTVVNRLFVCVQKAVALGNLWELEEYGFGEEEHTGKYCTVLPCSTCVVAPLGRMHRPELAAHGLQSQHTQTSTHTSISCSSGNIRL